MPEQAAWVLETLRESGEFTTYRGRRQGDPFPVFVVALTAEQPSLRASGSSSTNTRWQPNSIPPGQRGRWRSLVTKGGRSSYSRTLAVSPWIAFLSGARRSRSI